MKSSTIYELNINTKNEIATAIVKELLKSIGIQSTEIVETRVGNRSFLKIYFKSRKLFNKSKLLIEKEGIKNVRTKVLKNEDWQNKWKKEFKPFNLTNNYKVVPLWLKGKYNTNKIPIYIDSNLAFGTGLHETTRFMSQFINNLKGKYESFLDIGSGTGIL